MLIGIDALLVPLAVWLSFWLRLAHPLHPSFQVAGLWLLPAVLLIGLPLVALTGQVKGGLPPVWWTGRQEKRHDHQTVD